MSIEPKLPPHQRITYSISSPIETHTREATCDEVECDAQARGWITRVDERTPLGKRQANYIRSRSGRKFVEQKEPDGTLSFVFAEGQRCFAEHRTSLERPELYIVRGGDHRGNPRGEIRVHSGPDPWIDDFATHTEKLRAAQE